MNENFIKALEVFWKGMLAIFIAITIIFISIALMNRLINKKAKNNKIE